MIEKVMYKVKDNTFRVQDFTKKDNVDESKFVEGKSQRGKKQLQAQVCVLYPDEYHDLKTKLDAHESQVQHLKAMISERESEIIRLKKQINEKEQANSDEVKQLKEDISNITQDYEKEVSKLQQEKAMLEKSHLEELDKLKETHANQLSAIDETHKNEIKKLEEQYNAKLDKANDKLLSEVQANKQASDNLREEILTMTKEHTSEIDKIHQEKSSLETSHANEMLELEKAHQDEITHLKEDISQIKQDHIKEINEKDKSHNDRHEKMRSYFLKIVTLDNKEDVSEIVEIEKSIPSLLKPFMRKHIKQVEDMKERKILKEPEKIIKTYELSGKKEKE